MEPEKTLGDARKAAHRLVVLLREPPTVMNVRATRRQARLLVQHFERLDAWLTHGGGPQGRRAKVD